MSPVATDAQEPGSEPGSEPVTCEKEVSVQQVVEERGENHLPMDHGVKAWLQVLGCWILFANTWCACKC